MRAHRLVWILLGITCSTGTRAPSPASAQVRPGIEVLLTDSAHLIAGKRLGLLSNNTGVDRWGRRDVDVLRTAPGVRLTRYGRPFRASRWPGLRQRSPNLQSLWRIAYRLARGGRFHRRAAD